MTVMFAIVLVVHGAIHVLGFAKAFGLADLPQLMLRPVSIARLRSPRRRRRSATRTSRLCQLRYTATCEGPASWASRAPLAAEQ
jgi:hypothetical protein